MKSKFPHSLRRTAAVCLAISLSACGGGGGGDTGYNGVGRAPAELVPTSGFYVPVTVINGSTDIEISAAHPSAPNKEFTWSSQVVRAKAASVSYTAQIDAQGNISNYAPHSLKTVNDFVIGDVSLSAGGRPVYLAQTMAKKYCSFQLSAGWLEHKIDFTPQFGSPVDDLTHAGNNGICGDADDQLDEQKIGKFFNSSNNVHAALDIYGNLLVGKDEVYNSYLSAIPSGVISPNSTGNQVNVILNTPTAVLFEDAFSLHFARPAYAASSSPHWDSLVFSTIKKTKGWKSIGYDDTGLYVARNSSDSMGYGDWEVLKINPLTGASTAMGSGAGFAIHLFGKDKIFTYGISNAATKYTTQILNKSSVSMTYRSSHDQFSIDMPFAAGTGYFMNYVAKNGYAGIDIYKESSPSTVHKSIGPAYLVASMLSGALNINRSPESTVLYVKQASLTSSSSHAGGQLASYDPVIDQEVVYGTLPAAPIGGQSKAVGVPFGGKLKFQSYALQGVDGTTSIVSSGARKFTFEMGKANSLTELTGRVQLND